jgi:hypothetical protein
MGAKQNDPPNNNGGMIHQTDGKLLSKMIGYFVGGGGYTASNCLKDWLTLSITSAYDHNHWISKNL